MLVLTREAKPEHYYDYRVRPKAYLGWRKYYVDNEANRKALQVYCAKHQHSKSIYRYRWYVVQIAQQCKL